MVLKLVSIVISLHSSEVQLNSLTQSCLQSLAW